jgi:CheY-like chemotaxis protein
MVFSIEENTLPGETDMRLETGGLRRVSRLIERDLEFRDCCLSKPQRAGLADIAASVLACGSVNTSELSQVLPRKVKSIESNFRYIHRWLSNEKIDPHQVMSGFSAEAMELLSAQGQTIVLMLDQSKMIDGFEVLMVSLRTKERAIPILWAVVATSGAIGFEVQSRLLHAVANMIPGGTKVILMADRFYGTAAMVELCQRFNFGYRIRLKCNLTLEHEGGELNGHDMGKLGLKGLEKVKLCGKITTNVGYIHEPGHDEAWLIAMDEKPSRAKVLDYGLRWGIESMFSDLKSRGFNINKTQLKTAPRLSRLLLVLTVAMMWAVSTGWYEHQVNPVKKN